MTIRGERLRYFGESVTLEPEYSRADDIGAPFYANYLLGKTRVTIVGELIHPKRRRKHAQV